MSCAPPIASAGVAAVLRHSDCLSAEASSFAFAHLFGPNGSLTSALSTLLTIYIACLAISMLAGRSSLSELTPRAITVGLVLTFCTSWSAYQNVVWKLASGAPDQVASIVSGTQVSASSTFVQKLDLMFTTLSDTAKTENAVAAESKKAPSPSNDLIRTSALIMLLSTAGTLLASRLVLVVLLAFGPVFISLALFSATRGIFEGWVKALVLFALAPGFIVVAGLYELHMIAPLIESLKNVEAQNTVAVPLFLHATVFAALMLLSMGAGLVLVNKWRLLPKTSAPTLCTSAHFFEATATPEIVRRSSDPEGNRITQIVAAAQLSRIAPTSFATASAISPSTDSQERLRGLTCREYEG